MDAQPDDAPTKPCEFCGFADAILDNGSWICADCLDDSNWVANLPSRQRVTFPQHQQ